MPKNHEHASLEQLKTLCNCKNGVYTSKSGKEYIKALSKIFELNNQNDIPFTVDKIKEQPIINDFVFAGVSDFDKVCKLVVSPMIIENDKRKNEKIKAEEFVSDEMKTIFETSTGIVYIMTCEIDRKEHIIKIGSTRTSFEKRLNSYNCGYVYNWRTASTTNIKILQSMVTTRKTFYLYIFDCSETATYTWHGVKSVAFPLPKYLAFEDILIKEYIKQFNQKPLANIQANATEV